MKRVHLPVVHRSVSQEWLLIFRCQVRCVWHQLHCDFSFFGFLLFFFRKWNVRKKEWTGPLEVQGETSLAFQLGMWTSEKDSNLSLYIRSDPLKQWWWCWWPSKHVEWFESYKFLKVDRNVERERERCMHDHWCVIISFWVICPVKNRCKSTYLLFDVLKALCESLWCPYL